MLKIALIGIGNAGNQIANNAYKQIPSFCINTSEKDLNTLSPEIPVFLLGDNGGVGKDRRLAKNLLKSNFRALLGAKIFEEFIADQDIVFVVSSTGGGTGSGLSIMTSDILSRVYPNKLFINIGLLPTIYESVGAQRNTLEYLKELKGMGKSYMLYDNNKYKNSNPSEYMEKINKEIVDTLLYLTGEYNFTSNYGMIDDADMHRLLSVPGMINVTEFSKFMEKDMEDGVKLDTYLIKAMKANGTCQLDKDRIIRRMGVIVNLTKELTPYYDSSMAGFKSAVGEPLEVFEHYYVIEDEDTQINRIAVILSGLSIPDDRIELIVQRIQEVEEALSKKKETSLLDGVQDLDSLRVDGLDIDRTKANDKVDLSSLDIDFLDNY